MKIKFVGLVTDDIDRMKFLKKCGLNFYKVTSGMMNNTKLQKH